jgi:Xylose isomerase-like TIM barrel
MQLKLIRHLWGIEIPNEIAFGKIKAEGFVGIESPLPPSADEGKFRELLASHGFEYIPMGFTGGADVAGHLQSFKEQLQRGNAMGAKQMTFHCGSDAWNRADAESFYQQAVAIERDSGVAVGHETHRGRIFFNPWITRDILQKFEGVKLTCDFSHWVCVAERTYWDDANGSILKLCADRCIHIHSRVGYSQGPQVPDPSAPEYQGEVEEHLKWWQSVWESQKRRGFAASTVTPEFGPPGYLHTLPHTNVPVADLWKVCKYMADRVRDKFESIL